jgi:molybdopterin-guanine dinucleotide biosynthesis protein MobB
MPELPPMIGIVGRKNSGKTTLLVAVAAELKRRGLRVASVKHGHHAFEIDHPGRDSWRHVHEGEVEAVLFLSSGKLAMVMQMPGEEPGLEEVVRRHFAHRGFDLVLVEGFKHGDLPKIEIHRRTVDATPLCASTDTPAVGRFIALVTDDPDVASPCRVIALGEPNAGAAHVAAVADLIVARLAGQEP